MTRATFGDFARAAGAHLDMPASAGSGQAVREVTGALLRITEVMTRYAADISTVSGDVLPGDWSRLAVWTRAAAQAREALDQAAALLRASPASAASQDPAPASSPLARGLHAAATSMTAGRDLLHTHFTLGPGGERQGRSEWALVITSPAVTRALLGETAIWARRIAPQAGELALARGPGLRGTGESRRRLHAAGQCLWSAHAAIQAAHWHDPVTADDRRLLHAIPVATPQPRHVPDGTETITGLCAGIISTAERLRHAAPIPPSQPAWDPGLTIGSLRQVAATSTVTSHHCHLLLDALATRAARAGHGQLSLGLAESAAAARHARDQWLHAAGALDQVTTDVRGYLSPAATEAGDLALWTGRLAYADPRWTLSSGPAQPTRPPQQLAAGPDDIPGVLAAVHHTAQTLSHLARADQQQIRSAAQAGRILVPTRSLPESDDIARRYTTAPPYQTGQLLSAYGDAGTASAHTTAAIAGVAETVHAPSRSITLARAAAGRTHDDASHSRRSLPEPAIGAQPPTGIGGATMKQVLRGLGIVSPDLLRRASTIDRAREQLISDATHDRSPTHDSHRAMSFGRSREMALTRRIAASGEPSGSAMTHSSAPRQPEPPEIEP